MATYVSVNDLQVGDFVRYQVGGSVERVTAVDGTVSLANGVQLDTGYVEVMGRLPQVRYMRNAKSGITHAVIGERTLCGSSNGRNSSTAYKATCERCLEILEK